MRAVATSARERLLRRHAAEVRLACGLALGDAANGEIAAAAAIDRARAELAAGARPADARPWLLALALEECAGRARAPGEAGDPAAADPWEPVRRLPPAERTALILHEGVGLGVRQTARALGVDWRAGTDLLFSARAAVAREGGPWEPIECTAHRRLLSDAGRRRPPRRTREHLDACEGCRRMGSATAARRAAARPPAAAAPTLPAVPRLRPPRSWARPALVAGGALAAVAIALVVVLAAPGGAAPDGPAPVASAEPTAAPEAAPVAARPAVARRARARHAARRASPGRHPKRHRHAAGARHRRPDEETLVAEALGDEPPVGAAVAAVAPRVADAPSTPRRRAGGSAATRPRTPAPSRPRRPPPPRTPSPTPSGAPAAPPATTPSAPAGPADPPPSSSPPAAAAGEPSTPAPADPAPSTPPPTSTAPQEPSAPPTSTSPATGS